MTYESIIKGLDEAIKINKSELKGTNLPNGPARRIVGMVKYHTGLSIIVAI